MLQYVKPFLRAIIPRTFVYNNKKLEYWSGLYNGAFANERTIELPIVFDAMKSCKGDILEIGNVTQHYWKHPSIDVVDKYEVGPGVKNIDIMDYYKKYDLIVSISTFEHIGLDEEDKRESKVFDAIHHCKKMLKPNGKMIITIPTSYNGVLDRKILGQFVHYDRVNCYRRVDAFNNWEGCSLLDAVHMNYGAPYLNANGLYVLEFDAKS